MRWMALFSAFMVMLRVSGLAPDLPWSWAFAPIWMPVGSFLVVMVMALILAIARGR